MQDGNLSTEETVLRPLKIILTVTLMLFAATSFAAKKEKELICHVGNEAGPEGEVYLDDPGCVPIEENGYFCPDAGKIDLIEVANTSKHLNNPSHTFNDLDDYLPGEVGASGVGNEDSNGDGVDDGCEPPILASCPCWTTEELNSVDGIHSDGSEMLISVSPSPSNYCEEYADIDGAYNSNLVWAWEDYHGPGTGFCQTQLYNSVTGYARQDRRDYFGEGDPSNTLTLDDLNACIAEAQACIVSNTQ